MAVMVVWVAGWCVGGLDFDSPGAYNESRFSHSKLMCIFSSKHRVSRTEVR
jgi:hypothetical protein